VLCQHTTGDLYGKTEIVGNRLNLNFFFILVIKQGVILLEVQTKLSHSPYIALFFEDYDEIKSITVSIAKEQMINK
jgi:hypothetical protein